MVSRRVKEAVRQSGALLCAGTSGAIQRTEPLARLCVPLESSIAFASPKSAIFATCEPSSSLAMRPAMRHGLRQTKMEKTRRLQRSHS